MDNQVKLHKRVSVFGKQTAQRPLGTPDDLGQKKFYRVYHEGPHAVVKETYIFSCPGEESTRMICCTISLEGKSVYNCSR